MSGDETRKPDQSADASPNPARDEASQPDAPGRETAMKNDGAPELQGLVEGVVAAAALGVAADLATDLEILPDLDFWGEED